MRQEGMPPLLVYNKVGIKVGGDVGSSGGGVSGKLGRDSDKLFFSSYSTSLITSLSSTTLASVGSECVFLPFPKRGRGSDKMYPRRCLFSSQSARVVLSCGLGEGLGE